MKLNESQMYAVNRLNGPVMVLAGPGSGKTTVIAHRAYNLINSGVSPWQVLVIAFSKAAATEMEQRFIALNGGKTGCTFGTFHGIFFRVLRKRYGYAVEQVLQENECRDMINKLLIKLKVNADEDTLTAVRNEISLVKNELHELKYYNSNTVGADVFRDLYLQYENEKNGRNKIDFDDMLLLCFNLWQNEPENLKEWRNKFKYIMIDEFQDINHVQYECVRMLSAAPHNLCIVGDDDQSIYRFRGARPEFLLRFPNDYPGVESVVLDTNYRSTEPIISFGNKLISQNSVRYDKIIVGTQKNGPPPKILNLRDQNHEAAYIAGKIKKLPDLNDAAVIYRTNIQARAFMDAFMQANIPYIVKDEVSVIYEHWIAQDIFAYLRLCRNLGDRADVERIINKPFRFISKAFLSDARQKNHDIFSVYASSTMLNSAQQQRIEELADALHVLNKLKTTAAIRYLRKNCEYDRYLKEYCEYRKINPSGLYEIAAELQESAEAFEKPEDFMDHAEEAVQNKNAADTDGERVTLTTMHSAKGLEFDTVFIAGAVEGLIPHERSKTAAELEEECRLLYVGATRAKTNLYISVIKSRHEKKVEPSRFVKKMQKRSLLNLLKER